MTARIAVALAVVSVAACDIATDPATRLAYDIESGAKRLGDEAGATYTVSHATPSKPGECTGPYKLQLDDVGAIFIWCKDAVGETVSSHSTTYHSNFVDSPKTFLLDKGAGEVLAIDLKRRGSRAIITDVR